ncbi:Bacterial type II/III secretion system short domain protein [Posidoniimonas corsicana]|uniref:Bacterial type II/III secretion system short domain protein n=1 Tax=Posidoniimonas corsicana TaxID=1938618 RepID=A0A5C5V4Y5_9BACT|nr:secretin N-terminal domain-containing protein [Posidoniimonas corsicana]TWT33594.1 Bacterial type II/III secretion system short domain protein [Posidoniimonas corsicana]
MDRDSHRWRNLLLTTLLTATPAWANNPAATPDAGAAEPPAATAAPGAPIQFSFSGAEWPTVLEWMAENAGLSLDLTDVPPGTFSYIDDQRHTVPGALDVLNGYLLPRGYVLLRRDQFLVAMKTDNPVLANLIPTVPASTLSEYGDNELLRIVVPVKGFQPQEVAEQMLQLLGPRGMAAPLDSSGAMVLQGFGKSLREAVELLASAEPPPADDELIFRSFALNNVAASDAERQIQNLFGLGTNPFQAAMQRRAQWQQQRRGRGRDDRGGVDQGNQPASPTPLVQEMAMNMKVSALRHTNSLLVTATPAAIKLVESILETIDVPSPDGRASAFTSNTPELRVYTVENADEDDVAETVDSVIPGVVINEDGRNNSIHVLATPAEHAEIEQLITTIDSGGMGAGVEVIPLSQSDPQMMSELLAQLFDNEDRDDRPVITPNFRNRSLIVRGSSAQVAEMRKALTSFQEGEGLALGGDSSRFRRLPLSGSGEAERVARVVKELLEADDEFDNQIRVVAPGGGNGEQSHASDDLRRAPVDTAKRRSEHGASATIKSIAYETDAQGRVVFAVAKQPAASPAAPAADQQASENPDANGERVTIEVRGDELLMYSNDGVALDQVENTIRELVRQMPARKRWTVFFLRAAPAETTAQTLVELLRGDAYSDVIVGSGPDYGFSSSETQTMRIVPDARTNSLFVSGPEERVARAERFLKFLDTTELPESLRDRVPRSIQVEHADANDVAQIIRELYKDFMVDPAAEARAARRDDRRGDQRRASVSATQSQSPGLRPLGIQLTLAVDEAANTLLVSCNDQLFQQISELVDERDTAAQKSQPVVRVLQMSPGTAESIRAALDGLAQPSDAEPTRDDRRRRERSRR